MPWSPDPGTPLHGTSEANAINIACVYTPEPMTENPVSSYQGTWLTTPRPDLVTLTPTGGGLIVAGANVTGMAIISVSYMRDNAASAVTRWIDLPVGALDIFRYTINGSNIVTAQFRARATLVGGAIRDAVYTIQAVINYTSGRDRLVAEIAARS